jgi:hypothetical protein
MVIAPLFFSSVMENVHGILLWISGVLVRFRIRWTEGVIVGFVVIHLCETFRGVTRHQIPCQLSNSTPNEAFVLSGNDAWSNALEALGKFPAKPLMSLKR